MIFILWKKWSGRMKKKNAQYIVFLIPYLFILVGFILLPMLSILAYSLIDKTSELPIYSFTFSNYSKFFESYLYLKCILKSLYLALVSTIVCLVLCYPIAYFIARRKPQTQAVLVLLVTAPMWVNMLLRTLAIKQVFDGPLLAIVRWFNPDINVIIGNDFSVIFGMVYNYVPYMILPIYTSLSKLDPRLLEASTDLGAKNYQTLLNVIVPLSVPGVISGITITFLSCATTITITKYLGEGRYFLIGNLIETEFITNSRWSFGSAISMILLIVIMLVMFIINKFNKEEKE